MCETLYDAFVRKLPRLVVVLGVVSLLTDLSSEMILPLLPTLLLGTLGATPVVVGLVDGVADALSAVLKLVFGRLSDRSVAAGGRRKPYVVAGYALSTVVRPLVALAGAPWHVVAVRAVDRVGKGVRSSPRDALIADVVDDAQSTRAYAYHRMMDHTGAVLGPLVAAALLAIGLSAREAIAAAWVPGALAVLALIVFAREPPRAAAPVPSVAAAVAAPAHSGKLPRELARFVVVAGLFSIGVLADSFVLVRARDLGTPDALLPIVWSVLHVAKVIAAALIGRTTTAQGEAPRAIAAAWLTVAAGIALLAFASHDAIALVWIGAAVAGVGHGAREPLEKALVRARAPADARGRAFGAYHLVTGLCALPAGLGVGLLWQRLGTGAVDVVTAGRLALFASAGVVVTAAIVLVAVEVARRAR
jgi:Na+/melibiose symporter-like transporter